MSEQPGPRARSGTRLLIVGLALSITGLISIAALLVQLALYDPPCEVVAWEFVGACSALRILVVLMLPFLVAGIVLVALGFTMRRRDQPPANR